MLVKIKSRGWETYTGVLGMADFIDGQSVSTISVAEAYSLGSMVDLVEIDSEGNELGPISAAHDLLTRNVSRAPVEQPRRRLSDILKEEAARMPSDESQENKTPKTYTADELEAIASEKGISGIRDIATPLGIKGVSIRTMITEILIAQPKNVEAVEPTLTPVSSEPVIETSVQVEPDIEDSL